MPAKRVRYCKIEGCTNLRNTQGYCSTCRLKAFDLKLCSFEGCSNPTRSRSGVLCPSHWSQQRAGKQLTPIFRMNEQPCQGPSCDRLAKYRDGYCTTHHRQMMSIGTVWVIGTKKHPGRAPILECVEDGCAETLIYTHGRCRPHAREEAGECWLPWCTEPGTHEATGLCPVDAKRNASMRARFGIDWQDRLELSRLAGGKCAVCGYIETLPDDPLHIDHDHETYKVRGLLCGGCNRGLGAFKDDPDRLVAAAEYMRRHRGG